MEAAESIRERILEALPEVGVEVVENPSPSAQYSLLVAADDLPAVARFLKGGLKLDYCSNVTGVDVPDRVETTKTKEKRVVDGEETEIEKVVERKHPGYLEAVYHLYSMSERTGPVIVRARTGNRSDQVALPSLTPVWRSCELQEREIYDLYGIRFEGHPDLRRLLMWDGFADHPMRKDYVEPDDYEYEPTPHNEVLERVQSRESEEGH